MKRSSWVILVGPASSKRPHEKKAGRWEQRPRGRGREPGVTARAGGRGREPEDAASAGWKCEGNGFFPAASRSDRPCRHLDWSLMKPSLIPGSPEPQETRLCCFKPLCHVYLWQQQKEPTPSSKHVCVGAAPTPAPTSV